MYHPSILKPKISYLVSQATSKKYERERERDRKWKETLSEEELAEVEAEEQAAREEIFRKVERGRENYRRMVNGEDLLPEEDFYDHPLTLTPEEIKERDALYGDDEED